VGKTFDFQTKTFAKNEAKVSLGCKHTSSSQKVHYTNELIFKIYPILAIADKLKNPLIIANQSLSLRSKRWTELILPQAVSLKLI
jgi:hypothetical protein